MILTTNKGAMTMSDPHTKLAQIVVNQMSSQEKEDKLISLLAGHYYEFDSAFSRALEKHGLNENDLQDDEWRSYY